MKKLEKLSPERVFYYFEEISKIPRGSGNMEKISEYCIDFAKQHNLKAAKDDANNVIIFKDASKGYENSEPIILQGHLDMVCQKEEDCDIDFLKDGVEIYVDGDFVKAKGTTLGADNGIAIAMILSILESNSIEHPPIEAIFTTDEEIGMIGAGKLSTDAIKGRRLINIDAEEPDVLTVSCAGGSDFKMYLETERKSVLGKKVILTLKGLKGGHSGIEIDKGRINANILAGRILNHLNNKCDFEIIGINGGDKTNAITNNCKIELVVKNIDLFNYNFEEYINIIKKEIADREEGFDYSIDIYDEDTYDVVGEFQKKKLIFMLNSLPNGVIDMSTKIEGLVETSLNIGILKTDKNEIIFHFALRSNKRTVLEFLEEKLSQFASYAGCRFETSGHYMPWEFKENSHLQKMYKECFSEYKGYLPEVMAIHAGLECGVLSSRIENLDCIAIGPKIYDAHTVNERLSISSTKDIYEVIKMLLKKCK